MAKKIIGSCCICGTHGEMSAEHVPPRAAFNEGRFWKGRYDNGLPFGPDEMSKKQIVQGGIKFHTLCTTCNNNTGGWYAKDFSTWCHWGNEILTKTNGKPSLIYCHRAYPLRIIKQVATMFFSLVGPDFHRYSEELVRFVLNKEERGLSTDYRFFTYYNLGSPLDKLRYSEPIVTIDTNTGQSSFFFEITFPPFGYVMVLENTTPPDERLVEISRFANYSYYGEHDIEFSLPVLPTHLRMPGDYRSLT